MEPLDQSKNREIDEAARPVLVEAVMLESEALAENVVPSSEVDETVAEEISSVEAETSETLQRGGFDWPALIAALAVAAFFALTARFNSQPSPSYIPAAVFSATGCGLLVTAVHKLRRRAGAALLEAGLSGFGMALFQFAMTFTYARVFSTITTVFDYGRAFLLTWSLVALFAVILSLAGATIGHLAFAPLRPLPPRAHKRGSADEEEDEDADDLSTDAAALSRENEQVAPFTTSQEALEDEQADDSGQEGEEDGQESRTQLDEKDEGEQGDEDEQVDDEDEDEELVGVGGVQPRRSLLNYVITILLLGLLPMMAGYVFAATYDFVMNAINVNSISPALYPTLSLLSGLLPWRLAAPITLSGTNGAFIVFTLLWRVPDSVLGNPNLFDVQALESLVFNAAGLALLLITMYRNGAAQARRQPAPLGLFVSLEVLFGLILVLPANLWLLRGLEGILQMGGLVAQLPTIQLLNPTLFILNLVTGALFCLIVGLIVRRQYQLWTAPRIAKTAVQEEEDAEKASQDSI